MMVPKSFRLPDWQATALHDVAQKYGMDDGDYLRRIVLRALEEEGIKFGDYVFPVGNEKRTTR